jgi:two-component system response regulator PilR (NtrC family)
MAVPRDPNGNTISCARVSRVLVCDPSRPCNSYLHDVIAGCGAVPSPITASQALDAESYAPDCPAALVAGGASFPDGRSAPDIIEHLSRCGVSVIAYADGVNAWPLARRCKFLLHGCSCLLDSAAPAFPEELRRAVERALQAAGAAAAHDRDIAAAMAAHGVVGESRAMLAVFASVLRISALSDLPTLLTGESGTGKDLLARAIHARDPKRCAGPFVALNCGAIAPTLAEAELFGHRRGAFTGADRDRRGLFRAADGGVLFLDEIAELDASVQVKLLRVLQDNRVLSVGDEREAAVSVRVIAATNSDLREMIERRLFRADLFHRLNVVSIHVPPVRDRRADIRPLVEHFVRKHHGLSPAASTAIDAEFVDAFSRLDLHGNAREVENLVRSALVHNDGTAPLRLADLPAHVWQQLVQESPAPAVEAGGREEPLTMLEANGWNLSRTLRACERSCVQAAFRVSHGNQSKTARLLGITPRSVYNKLRRHRIA